MATKYSETERGYQEDKVMENQRFKGSMITAIVLAVCIVISAALCVLLFLKVRPQKLNQTTQIESGEAERKEDSLSNGEQNNITQEMENHTVAPDIGTAAQNEVADNDQIVYLNSETSIRVLTLQDVEVMKAGSYDNLPEGKSMIQMVINEMYARYGFRFTNQNIQNYFESKEWYQNITERSMNMDEIYQKMTDIEKANIEFLTLCIEEV